MANKKVVFSPADLRLPGDFCAFGDLLCAGVGRGVPPTLGEAG